MAFYEIHHYFDTYRKTMWLITGNEFGSTVFIEFLLKSRVVSCGKAINAASSIVSILLDDRCSVCSVDNPMKFGNFCSRLLFSLRSFNLAMLPRCLLISSASSLCDSSLFQ